MIVVHRLSSWSLHWGRFESTGERFFIAGPLCFVVERRKARRPRRRSGVEIHWMLHGQRGEARSLDDVPDGASWLAIDYDLGKRRLRVALNRLLDRIANR